MLRRARLKPTGFKPKPRKEGPSVEKPERPLIPATLKPLRMGVYGGTTSCQPVAKECASQSPAYQNAVRSLGYCMLCRKSCRPQFCHADAGKGCGIKTDVRRGWPGCAECHYLVGTSGQYAKERRRALEADLAGGNGELRRARDPRQRAAANHPHPDAGLCSEAAEPLRRLLPGGNLPPYRLLR